MLEEEYFDTKRFPLTTQAGLTLKQQKLIDAVNHDDIKRMMEEGRPLGEQLLMRLLEYQAKAALRQSSVQPQA
jgi:hypothetical protein